MEDIKIWALNGSQATPLNAVAQAESERELEGTLVNNPGLLMEGLTLVGRQTPTEGGPLDLLGVDEYGRLVVFELKRGILARDAVAQVIDYASHLDGMDLADLCNHISERSGTDGIDKIEDFAEWHNQHYDELESLKPLRLFLVGLGADDRTERMVKFLADNGSIDISLLTFHGFETDGKTLLAKQVEVDGRVASERRRTSVNSSRAERWDMIHRRADSFGIRATFDSAVDMFRETWGAQWRDEYPNRLSLRIALFTKGMRTSERPSVRLESGEGEGKGAQVWLNFNKRAFSMCEDAFERAMKSVTPRLSPRRQTNWRDAYEIQFPLTAEDWERHKETIASLAKAVYAAWEDTVGVGESN